MRIVVALGGNALLRRGESMEQAAQERNVAVAVRALAALAADHELVVTHGNGPQVGMLALAHEASGAVTPYSLDVVGAESQGMIGFLLEEAVRRALPAREVATLLTQVLVDRADPAFAHPTKPIGRVYGEAEARRLAAERGWAVAPDGDGYRRVVSSPRPRRVLELAAIRLLVHHGVLVICAGGGGVPVVAEGGRSYYGVEAVVDKDLTTALLAYELHADLLLLLTDVAAVERGWQTPQARAIRAVTPLALRSERFDAGTMGPKVEAACSFVERTGKRAAIGALADARELLLGRSGTAVVPEGITPMSFWDEVVRPR